ncbi:MAG: hypothetical protein JAY88_14730 [Candidatus Thiodiazotropha lotti]|nr:hypothetical protein [Candidatus Thiodiazotropha lotti]MCW4188319.1 hypothetical protein [Candidatus Thiodiazotropha lotti]
MIILGDLKKRANVAQPPTSAGEIFSWSCEDHPLGDIYNGSSANHPFDQINWYNNGTAQVVDTVANGAPHSGSRCIQINYTQDESEVNLQVNDIRTRVGGTTNSLFTRKYERFGPEWIGNWPRGLKTGRYFTGYGIPQNGYAYHSEKMVWNDGYASNESYGRGMNSALGDLDLIAWYGAGDLFGNGLPYLRADHWYKIETWMVLDSAVDANDGVLQIWIDDVLVYNNTSVPWRQSTRGCSLVCLTLGEDWTNMWFGGNYTNSGTFPAATTLRLWIDDLYMSTTLDR